MSIKDPLKKLRQHHHATIGLFFAFWICAIVAILILEFGDVSEGLQNSLLGALLGGVVVVVLLQFSARCPVCRANLGWQQRLGVPKHCRQCGRRLR